MDANLGVTGDVATLTLAGVLTVEHAGKLKSILMEALAGATSVRVEFGRVSEIDLSCLQLLCAAHRTASGAGKAVTVRPDENGAYLRTISLAGFVRREGCEHANMGKCLWQGGDHL